VDQRDAKMERSDGGGPDTGVRAWLVDPKRRGPTTKAVRIGSWAEDKHGGHGGGRGEWEGYWGRWVGERGGGRL